ncbi:MAG TPA: ABC transporter ATP-binding protein [Chloroflexota bacterium]
MAIARALATRPRLLLLDEPLSNLDAALREEMRVELVRLLKAQGITAIYVTHDRVEALAMADHIVVLRDGRIAQMGTPEELYSRPANAFIAGFLGAANFIPGDTHLEPGGMVGVHRGAVRLRGMPHGQLNGKGTAVPRPEDGTLHANQPDDAVNALPGEVIHSEFLGGRWRHVIAVGEDCVVQAITAERAPAQQVWVYFPPERCLVLRE